MNTKQSITSADSANLWNIATLDRKIGGRAVIQARNMIQSLADTMYIWEADSQQVQTSNKMAQNETITSAEETKLSVYQADQKLQIIGLDGNSVIQIIDSKGSIVYFKNTNSQNYFVEFGEFPVGLYIVQIQTETRNQNFKILK